jgi:DNA processing protein
MAEIVETADKKYPKALKEALGKIQPHLGPKRLYYKGNWDEFFPAGRDPAAAGENCLAVVGSRHLTYYGRKAAEQLVGELASAGIVIVSGFMYGGDEAAHSAAVKVGGRTIAVMPCGIDEIHPKNQEKLYNEILENKGLIISEYEGNTLPQTFTYVQRDRLVAGLAKAVFVIEAALNSGSLITAGYAKKYGRKIFALPGPITSEVSRGTLKLIKEGAVPVTEAGDILKFYNISARQKSVAASSSGPSSSAATTLEEKIIEQLRREPMKIDDMARMFSVPVAKLGTTLSFMEMKGFVNQDNGKFYLS